MGSAEHESALEVVKATSVPIHDIGTAIYLSPEVFGWAAEWGWSTRSPSTSPGAAPCSATSRPTWRSPPWVGSTLTRHA